MGIALIVFASEISETLLQIENFCFFNLNNILIFRFNNYGIEVLPSIKHKCLLCSGTGGLLNFK
jgi:hypothetical protein